jgi:Mrp family chromosome partitioning ATPase
MVRFRGLLDQLRDEFSMVLVGLPVASELTPCFDMATELDGVIVEFESDRVKRSVAKATVDQLNAAGANLLGCVFKQL